MDITDPVQSVIPILLRAENKTYILRFAGAGGGVRNDQQRRRTVRRQCEHHSCTEVSKCLRAKGGSHIGPFRPLRHRFMLDWLAGAVQVERLVESPVCSRAVAPQAVVYFHRAREIPGCFRLKPVPRVVVVVGTKHARRAEAASFRLFWAFYGPTRSLKARRQLLCFECEVGGPDRTRICDLYRVNVARSIIYKH